MLTVTVDREARISSLSCDVLELVLRYVDLIEMVQSCSLVCGSWHLAVKQRLQQLDRVELCSGAYTLPALDSLTSLVSGASGHLTCLKLSSASCSAVQKVWQHLPCSKLQHLQLEYRPDQSSCTGWGLSDQAVTQDNTSFATASSLTSLHLQRCTLAVPPSLPSLQLLHLNGPCTFTLAPSMAGSSVPQAAERPPLSSMPKLTQLVLQRVPAATAAGPVLSQLPVTSIKQLELLECDANIPGAALRAMSQLQHLHIFKVLRSSHTGMVLWSDSPEVALSSEVLQVLPTLQHLTALLLDVGHTREIPAAAYSAVAGCSILQHLQLHLTLDSTSAWEGSAQQEQFWLEVFPPGQTLPDLRWLSLRRTHRCVSSQVIARIAQGCPALQHFSFQLCAPLLCKFRGCHKVHLQALQHLTALTSLDLNRCTFESVPCPGAASHSHAKELAAQLVLLPSVRSLELSEANMYSAYQLRPLTVVSQLTQLSYSMAADIGEPNVICGGPLQGAFVNQAPPGCPPDVPMQLLAHCRAEKKGWEDYKLDLPWGDATLLEWGWWVLRIILKASVFCITMALVQELVLAFCRPCRVESSRLPQDPDNWVYNSFMFGSAAAAVVVLYLLKAALNRVAAFIKAFTALHTA